MKAVRNILTCPFEVKAEGDAGQITGYASVFNNVDLGRDIVRPGAFTSSIAALKGAGRALPMLYQHDSSEPIGIWSDFTEDSRGLKCTGEIVMDTQRGREAHALMKRGAITGLSIGYGVKKETWDSDNRLRYLDELELREVSPVTFPMNIEARLTDVKRGNLTLREFEAFLRDEGGFSRSDARMIAEEGFKAWSSPRDEECGPQALSDLIAGLQQVNASFR